MRNGFTLIEVALVLLIAGILFGTLAAALSTFIKNQEISSTQKKLDEIDSALQLFLSLNGRYPCVSSLSDAPDTANFGVEILNDCSAAAVPAGTTEVAGPPDVRIGAVPVRTLNLPDTHISDAWGNRFTYAVTEDQASPLTYNRNGGGITVNDSAGNSVLGAGLAHYVIVSHGRDGAGATSLQGGGIALPCIPGNLDEENCNDDATFISTMLISDNINFYDDMIWIRSISPFGDQIPPGAIMAFNLNACPDGWTPVANSEGRVVMGAGTYMAELYSGFADRDDWSSIEETFALGDTGGFATWRAGLDDSVFDEHANLVDMSPITDPALPSRIVTLVDGPARTNATPQENRPPYITFLYCEKT